MRHLLIAILLGLILQSCVTQRKCLNKFPPDTTTKVRIVYRDTIIPFYVPATLPSFTWAAIDGKINMHLVASSGTAHGEARIEHDTLKLVVWQADTTLNVRLDSAIKVIDTQKAEIHTLREKYIPEWIKSLAMLGALLVGAFLFWFVSKFIKL